jgi:UDP-N-acetylglucosamine 2-epimerase
MVISPLGYFEALSLAKCAKLILTDSGGIQQEAELLKTPSITLRANTEWVEAVSFGVNFLAGSVKEIVERASNVERDCKEITDNFTRAKDVYGKPGASARMLDVL